MIQKYDTIGRNKIREFLKDCGEIADFGYGLEKIREDAIGYDFKEDSEIVMDFNDLKELKNKYDGFCMSHLLEHIIDIRKFLKFCYNNLNENGKIALICPDGETTFSETLGDSENTHEMLFTKKTLKIYLEHAGFKDVHTEYYERPYAYNKTKGIFGCGKKINKSFVKNYFDGKTGDELRKTITPNWDSTKEHIKLLNVPSEINSVLEIGCGIGRLLKEINKDVEYCVGVDASESMINEGKEYCKETNIKLLKCDGRGEIPIDLKNHFDFVFSIITFQHIPNINTVKKYISEMYNVLKETGIIKFQLLSNDEFPERELWTYHNIDDIIKYMKELGFNQIKKRVLERWTFIEGIK